MSTRSRSQPDGNIGWACRGRCGHRPLHHNIMQMTLFRAWAYHRDKSIKTVGASMPNKSDPWDELLHAIGQGWPHYKDIARPLIGTKHKKCNRTWLYFAILLIIAQMKGVQNEHI